MFENKRVLITGGTGSWSQELTKQLLKHNPKEIVIFSRGEFAQVTMQRKFNDSRLKFIIGDVRDFEAIDKACEGIDYVFHLAALKHVPICEFQPMEAIKTNVLGTENVCRAAIKNKVTKVIDVSSDKAVSPINVYGMSKSIGEKIALLSNSDITKFVCIRAGNVMGTNGSVIPLFIDQIKRFNKVTITDPLMTRYFMSLDEAIKLLLKASELGTGGELFVMRMPACTIQDLAKVLIWHYGNKDTQIEIIGSRPGEKKHEVLVSKEEATHTYELDNKYYIILPHKSDYKQVDFEEYSSNSLLMNQIEIEELLLKGKFIEVNENGTNKK